MWRLLAKRVSLCATRSFAADSNAFTTRTHNCGELRSSHVGERVVLNGWLLKKRLSTFFLLHDKYGFVQAIVPTNASADILEVTERIRREDVLSITGLVKHRGKDANPDMATGDIEVEIESIEVLNKSGTVPFHAFGKMRADAETEVDNKAKLTFRYVDLRKTAPQRALHLRAEVIRKMRRTLEDALGFIEVETPTLASHTPGGAAEFIVPTQTSGLTYALPQSPQLYKQLLMIGHLDRYYQVARCYRDEMIRGDRQPEFTQLDLELSFTTENQVLALIEKVILDSWPAELNSEKPKTPFRRLTFHEAMFTYGSDKPDLRLPWTFSDCSVVCREAGVADAVAHGFVVRKEDGQLPSMNNLRRNFARLFPDSLHSNMRFASPGSKLNVFGGSDLGSKLLDHFNVLEGDTLVVCFDRQQNMNLSNPAVNHLLSTLGFARNFVADALGLRSRSGFNFAWVTDFPLFVPSDSDPSKLESAHHPFTAPIPEDCDRLRRLEGLPTIRAQHYDLVVNGFEMGGGSIRIHDAELQRLVFNRVLAFPTDTLEPFLTALSFGAPPHGGFALGLDRYIACLASGGNAHASIRDVIAFPKTKEGRCLMMKTPFAPSEEMLQRYHCHFEQSPPSQVAVESE